MIELDNEIKIKDVIIHAPLYFIMDVLIWLIAHNIPLVIGYYTKLYFDLIGKYPTVGISIVIIGLILIRIVFIKIGATIDIKAQQKWSEYFYEKAFDSVKRKYDRNELDSGLLLEAINDDVSQIVGTISYTIDTICNILYGMIALCILFYIDSVLSIGIIILPVIALLINYLIKPKVLAFSQDLKNIGNDFSSSLSTILSESRNIRVNHLQKEFKKQINHLIDSQKAKGGQFSSWRGLLNNTTNMITELNVLIILLYFGINPEIRTLGAGNIILFVTYSIDIAGMTQYISSLIVSFNQSLIYLKDFNEKFLIRDNPKKDFEENNYNKILNQIVVGKINVIIGPNGSGKTNILKNIFNNIQNAVLLPNHMTLLSQSIYENITLGDENSLFEQSVSIAQLYPSEFEEGFEQPIEYGGSNISGGQLFRIALARTLNNSKDWILIDNNFTSIDPTMREKLLESLGSQNKTVIFVDQQYREYYQNYCCIYID
ncbi:MAG: ABC transporter transmembrane domain-containing protein [Sedimentibacter sp.]